MQGRRTAGEGHTTRSRRGHREGAAATEPGKVGQEELGRISLRNQGSWGSFLQEMEMKNRLWKTGSGGI